MYEKFYVHETAAVDLSKIYFLKNAKKTCKSNNRDLNRNWKSLTWKQHVNHVAIKLNKVLKLKYFIFRVKLLHRLFSIEVICFEHLQQESYENSILEYLCKSLPAKCSTRCNHDDSLVDDCCVLLKFLTLHYVTYFIHRGLQISTENMTL